MTRNRERKQRREPFRPERAARASATAPWWREAY